jgi:hypothetical protein
MKIRIPFIAGVALAYALAALANAAEFQVAVDGAPKGDGSPGKPWNLATALLSADVVMPGDTVWLQPGTYRGGFVSRLQGTRGSPVVVRGVRAGRVTIDTQPRDEQDNGLLSLLGADVVYRDFEVTCSHPLRQTALAGPWPGDIRRGGVDVRGDRLSLVNLVVHDCATGFGFWAEGEGGEISGCLIYYNGWRGPDRGHGHGIYAQNARGTKRIVDNVIFHQFGYGIHVYGSEKASLKGFEIDGNIVFENGCLAGDNAPGILVGGGSPAEGIAVRDNVVVGGPLRLGYPWGQANADVTCTGNYCDWGLVVRDFRTATVMHNTLVAPSGAATLERVHVLSLDGYRWDENTYCVTEGRWGDFAVVEGSKSRGLTFDEWRGMTGFDAKSSFRKGWPAQRELRVFVRPNAYERGRAHVAILNPAKLPEVDLDLSQVLASGMPFRVVSAKDVFGPSLVSGVYGGSPVKVPMRPVTPPAPVGMRNAKLPVTEPEFATFVVLPDRP